MVGRQRSDRHFRRGSFKFGKRITVNNGLSFITKPGGSHPVLMVTPFVTPIKKALPMPSSAFLIKHLANLN